MQAGARHAPAGCLPRVVAPATGDARAVLVAEMPLDMQDVAEDAVSNGPLELAHRRKAPLVVAEAKDDAGVATGGNRALGLAASESERLLAPDRLAGPRHRNDLIDVQRMRGRKHDRLHARIGNRVRKTRADLEAVRGRETGDLRGLVAHPSDEPQTPALALHGLDNRFAPPPEADNCSIYHGARPSPWTKHGIVDDPKQAARGEQSVAAGEPIEGEMNDGRARPP